MPVTTMLYELCTMNKKKGNYPHGQSLQSEMLY